MSTNRFSWMCCKKNLEKRKILENILPEEFKYKILSFKISEDSLIPNETKFDAIFALNVCSEEGIRNLLSAFQESSSTNYNMLHGDKRSGKTVLVSGYRKCHHNIRKRTKSGNQSTDPDVLADTKTEGKQTNCPASITFKLKSTKDHVHDENCSFFPLEVTIAFSHNHSIESANAVKYHDVRDETKEKFIELFKEDHSASSAYQAYKNYLMKMHVEKYVTISADRAIMPDYKWVFNCHATYMQEFFGKINSPEAFEKAKDKVKEYNEKHKEVLCVIAQIEGETIVAVCDKLSKRVHKLLPQAGDIVYVDATSNLDRQDSKLVKFMTCSPAGGLPLGFIVTKSESEITLTAAFVKLKEVLPDFAFYGRGKDKGPVLFMTDDADAEINALHTVWPDAKLLLCVWHVLNAVWRWLWDGSHQIKKEDRPHLLKKFRALLYANTESEYVIRQNELLSDNICKKYPHYTKHLQEAYFKRKEAWAISVRSDKKLPTHSTNTSNFVEASFRITKDGQFNRTKAFNLADLLDILLDDSVYYKKRLLDIGNGRMGAFRNSKSRYLLKKETKIRGDQIIEMGEFKFLVESEKNQETFYHVDMKSGLCECKAGENRGPCKHKDAITKFYNIAEFSALPNTDVNMRALYHFIAEGTVCNNSWYRKLAQPNELADIITFVEDRNIQTGAESISVKNNMDERNTEEMLHSEGNQLNQERESEEDDKDEILNHFVTAMDSFKSKIVSSYQATLKKGVKYFTKKLQKLSKQNDSSLEQSLFSIGKEMSNPKTRGKKKKIGKLIPVQVTAKSRREYKHRGRVVGTQGRRIKDQEKRVQMVVREEEDNVYHTLPRQKKVKNKQIHSLKNAVELNRPGAKKH